MGGDPFLAIPEINMDAPPRARLEYFRHERRR
jgi:hypothetical protein